jgi:hypothetical protein
MTSVGPFAAQAGADESSSPTGERREPFMTSHILLIGVVSVSVATTAALTAGFTTFARTAGAYGNGVGLMAGLLAGATAWALTFLTVATALHRLVR